jgi:hypothetical protein
MRSSDEAAGGGRYAVCAAAAPAPERSRRMPRRTDATDRMPRTLLDDRQDSIEVRTY